MAISKDISIKFCSLIKTDCNTECVFFKKATWLDGKEKQLLYGYCKLNRLLEHLLSE